MITHRRLLKEVFSVWSPSLKKRHPLKNNSLLVFKLSILIRTLNIFSFYKLGIVLATL